MRISEEIYQKFQNTINKYKGLTPQMYGNKKSGKTYLEEQKANKYKNVKVIYNGKVFDSIKEKNRYLYLKTLEEKGKISELELQKKFLLQESFVNNEGKIERAIYYIADFFYYSKELNCYIAEDVKSEITRTSTYKIKKKIFEYKYPNICFKEVL